jgi:hypothetical protein
VLDGRGWTDGPEAYFGTGRVFTRFCPCYLSGDQGSGIMAPLLVLAFCHGGTDPFLNAIAGFLGRSQVAFLGSTQEVGYDDAELIYPPLLKALAELGSNPEPVAAHDRLDSVATGIGAAWRTQLVQRQDAPI